MGGRRGVRAALSPFLIVLMAALGCAGAGGPGAARGTGGSGDAAGSGQPTSTEPTAVPPSSDAEPPASTLGFGDRAIAGVLGSYCWSSEVSSQSSIATCVDGAYLLVPGEDKTLAVPAGSGMVFDYGGEAPPDEVRAGAEPLGPDGETTGYSSRTLATGGSARGGRATIPAELPAGDYVVDVFVRVPEGDASYYFRVAVEGGGAALPGAGGPEDRSGELQSERKSP